MYQRILETLSKEIDHYFSRIEANHNFDLGPEFEIALCRLFQKVLPSRFGVCRGFIIDKTGKTAGDDIIIYDRLRFPTLRLLDEDFAQKECVPFEAVYAYFEAKHNLELDIDLEDTTFNKAISQLKKVRSLERVPRSLNQVTDTVTISNAPAKPPEGYPIIFNPLFVGIISRKVSLKKDNQKENIEAGVLEDAEKVYSILQNKKIEGTPPDLIVAGTKVLVIPTFKKTIETEKKLLYHFSLRQKSRLLRL